jgi:SAM-dependent methyltransferase
MIRFQFRELEESQALLKKNWPPKGQDWHRRVVGGRWEKIGALQLQFLRSQGLQPEHFLLDVGCGSLRAGTKFIDYLDSGRYFGIDSDAKVLAAGRDIEVQKSGLAEKKPTLCQVTDFDLSVFGRPELYFDFAMAQSVFTHLDPDMIEICLIRVMRRMQPGGHFFATFYESGDGSIKYGCAYPEMPWYPFAMFKEMAERIGMAVEYIGNWGHPNNKERVQRMLVFSHGGASEGYWDHVCKKFNRVVRADKCAGPGKLTWCDVLPRGDGNELLLNVVGGGPLWSCDDYVVMHCDDVAQAPSVQTIDLKKRWPYPNDAVSGVVALEVGQRFDAKQFLSEAMRVAKKFVVLKAHVVAKLPEPSGDEWVVVKELDEESEYVLLSRRKYL